MTTRRLSTRLTSAATTLAAASMALVLAACGGPTASPGSESTEANASPVAGGTLKVAFWPDNAAFACVDPFQTYWIEHRTVIRNVADSLTDQDPETGEIKPWLATTWEISKDGLTYTFHLRDGVTFSDGTPLDAKAVKANFDGAKKVAADTGGAAYGASYIAGYDHAEVVDPVTVKLIFAKPNASFLQATSTTNLAIISPASYEKTAEQRCAGDYVASGPFTLVSYQPNELTTLKKRPDYAWGSALSKNTKAAYLDEVQFSYVAEDSVRTGNLVSGAIDIAWPRNPFTVEDRELITKSGDQLESRSLPGVSYTFFANVSPGRPLADLAVRKAIYQALDLPTYAKTIFGPDYPVVGGAYDNTTPGFVSQEAKLRHDPEAAKTQLDQAGWKVGADGYRVKDGKKLTLSIPIAQWSVGSELIQDQLKQVGIEVKLDPTTAAERPAKIANGDYDLIENYFTRADPGALQYILDPDLANSKALAENATDSKTREQLKRLFAQATQTTDADQTRQAYAELQSLLIDQGVTFPIFERVQYAGVSKDVGGFAFTSESFLKLNDVWKQQ